MYKSKLLLAVFLVVHCSDCLAKVSPEYITPCVGLTSDCLKKNIQATIPLFTKGIPNLGVNSTDPLMYDHVKMELPGGLKVEFRNGVLTGLRKCIVDDVKFGINVGEIELHCNLTIKGKYKSQGQVLIVAINGDGDAKIKITNIVFKSNLKFVDAVRDGLTYYDVKDYKVTFDIKDKVHFTLSNLFKGNAELSQTVLQFLNENWRDVVQEFGKPLIDYVVNIGFGSVQEFFRKVPKNELVVL